MGRRKRRTFTPEYKAEVVRLAQTSGKTPGQIAREPDLTETAVRAWVGQAQIDAGGGVAGQLTTDERGELSALRRVGEDSSLGARDPKKSDGLLRQGDDVKFAFVAAEKAWAPVRVLCRSVGVSRSGFYAWMRRTRSARSREDAQLRVHIGAIHA